MSRIYRWGILGPGRIAEKFSRALDHTEGNEVYAVASQDLEKAKEFASLHQAKKAYKGYQQLVEDPQVDIIYIATPHAFHAGQAALCLKHKKPVLCEKPLALTYKEAQTVIGQAKKAGVFFMEGMWSSCMPAIRKALSIIEQDIIGPVEFLRADFGFAAPYDPNGRLFNLALGGGALLDVGVYPVFLAHQFLGEPKTIHSVGKLAPTGADEYCNMQFQYDGGQTAMIYASITVKTSLTAEIAGSKGRIYLTAPFYKSNKLILELNNGETNSFDFPHEVNGFEFEIRQIAACLDQGLLENPWMPHEYTLAMARVMGTVARQVGLDYGRE
ncbi:MAG: Gfo/Idh/MocA family oxidoreductase [Chitinophagaceae bacterium]